MQKKVGAGRKGVAEGGQGKTAASQWGLVSKDAWVQGQKGACQVCG